MQACEVAQTGRGDAPDAKISVIRETNTDFLNPAPIRVVERDLYQNTADKARLTGSENSLRLSAGDDRRVIKD